MTLFKLGKTETAQRDEIATRIEQAREKLDAAVTAFNDAMLAARETLQTEIDEYNVVLADAKAFADDVAQNWENDFEEKSERWQDGETGEAVRAMIEAWQSIDLEAIDIDMPDPEISFDAEVHSELLTDLPTEKE
jgi:exonuclease VII small subunit